MATSDNPLLDMTDAMTPYAGDADVPDETYRDTVLPGFKQALTARRSIRVFDGEPIPEEVMRDCLRDAIAGTEFLQPPALRVVLGP